MFFDDFKVTHTKSPVIQADDYYPFGLTFNSYQRENISKNKYLYNDGSEREDALDLGIDYTRFRYYDPGLGRWWQIDPKADQDDLVDWTPYNYSYNNPVLENDPNGDCPKCPTPRNRYQNAQNYRATVRMQQHRSLYRHNNRQNYNGPRQPVQVGTSNDPQTPQGQLVRAFIRAGDQYKKFTDKMREANLDVTVTKVETVSIDGAGFTKNEGSKFVFSGPDAANLEGMEMAYQSQVNASFDQQFAAYASEKLGVDFNSLSPDEQAKFKVDNMQAAGAIMMGVKSEYGPSPKQQVLSQIQEMLKQGLLVEERTIDDLPMISQGN